jgi:hypothetical protein
MEKEIGDKYDDRFWYVNCDSVQQMELAEEMAQDRVQWWVLVLAELNLCVLLSES